MDTQLNSIYMDTCYTQLNSIYMDTCYTQLNSIKIKWIQRLSNEANALWKDLLLYRLNLMLDSNQGLVLLRQI